MNLELDLRDIILLALTFSILFTGIIFAAWLQELRGCEDKVREYYKINQTIGMMNLSYESSIDNLGYQTSMYPKNITFTLDPGLGRFIACKSKNRFESMEEWSECQSMELPEYL